VPYGVGGMNAADPALQAEADGWLATIFLSPEGNADPAPWYQRLLERAPVHLSASGSLVLARYDDCRSALRDNRLGKGEGGPQGLLAGDGEALEYRKAMFERRRGRAKSMLALDPPDHTRQRSLVSRAFTPRRVEAIRPRIAELTDELLDDLAEAGTADLMGALATPLPVTVISEMLGVPPADWPTIRRLVTDLVVSLEPSASTAELQASEAAATELFAYFTELVVQRRRRPADDLLTALIEAQDEHDRLSEGEVLAVANLLFAAGSETTTNLIGNGTAALLAHPEQFEALWGDETLVPSAVEEMLRYDSPVQLDGRSVLAPTTVAGVDLEPGQRVTTLLGAANRDPAHFDRPNEFDVRRYRPGSGAEPVMSFASGIHYCLGANLARVEGQEVFAALRRRFARVERAGEPVRRLRLTLRGFETLPVTVTPR
jgi:cytochrome P450